MTDEHGDLDAFAALKQLALIFLASRYTVPRGRRRESREAPPLDLMVLRLPERFPQDIPIFPDSVLLGALTGGERIDVVLHTDRQPDDVVAWYRQHLTDAGWREAERPNSPRQLDAGLRGGFSFSILDYSAGDVVQGIFCRTPSGPSVQIQSRLRQDEPVVIILQVNLSTDPKTSPCTAAERTRQNLERYSRLDIGENIVPRMDPPPHAQQMGGGGGGSSGKWYTSASLETDLPLVDVVRHYEEQLVLGGWAKRGGEAANHAAWSRWEFTPEEGEDGRAYFSILQREDEQNAYDLNLRLLWTPDDDDRGAFGVTEW